MSKKVLIVGGVAGGASAAARLRRLDEKAEIIMFERGNHISFANCGLPYHIGDVIKDREKLLVQTPEAFNKKVNVDVRIRSEVFSIDSSNNTVKVNSKEKGVYTENYDYLLLSPGASPIKPNIPGIDSDKIFTLRNVDDTDRIKNYITSNKISSAVVVGGGFIGVEMAENLREVGLKISLIEAAPHILAPFDSDMVTIAEKELVDNGVSLFLGSGVKAFDTSNNTIKTTLSDDSLIESDMVILAIGVSPDTKFLQNSGLELGPKGHILVNEHLQTNIQNIYAVGDAIEVIDFVNTNNTAIPLAGPANKQGRIAADNICGTNSSYKGSQGTSVLKVFDLTCAATGNNERILQRLGIEYEIIYIHPQSHASYYPGATPISMKLLFNKSGKILGAQAIGYNGVEKRIDVLATTQRLGGTIYDLSELELSYAPPYSSAKDPVNMLGFIAENILSGKSEVVLPRDISSKHYDADNVVLLDIRTNLERESGYISPSVHIPLDDLRNSLDSLDKSKEYWVFCQVGLRGYLAERILKENGFKSKNITGGYKTFMYNNYDANKFNKDASKASSNNNTLKDVTLAKDNVAIELDACGLSCPGPLMKTNETFHKAKVGDVVKITASDPGFFEDIKAWSKRTNNSLLDISKSNGIITAYLQKGIDNTNINACAEVSKDNKTIVVFSGDLDKAIASFIIANGAASMGKKVTMFFTFWGINIIRKNEKIRTTKDIIEKMFGAMMPRGSKKLKLSQMNMGGIGSKMIRGIMNKHNVSSLEELIDAALKNGIEIVACQMSMELLGLKQEELIDGVKIGGVGYYLGEAEDSNVNLFI